MCDLIETANTIRHIELDEAIHSAVLVLNALAERETNQAVADDARHTASSLRTTYDICNSHAH